MADHWKEYAGETPDGKVCVFARNLAEAQKCADAAGLYSVKMAEVVTKPKKIHERLGPSRTNRR